MGVAFTTKNALMSHRRNFLAIIFSLHQLRIFSSTALYLGISNYADSYYPSLILFRHTYYVSCYLLTMIKLCLLVLLFVQLGMQPKTGITP